MPVDLHGMSLEEMIDLLREREIKSTDKLERVLTKSMKELNEEFWFLHKLRCHDQLPKYFYRYFKDKHNLEGAVVPSDFSTRKYNQEYYDDVLDERYGESWTYCTWYEQCNKNGRPYVSIMLSDLGFRIESLLRIKKDCDKYGLEGHFDENLSCLKIPYQYQAIVITRKSVYKYELLESVESWIQDWLSSERRCVNAQRVISKLMKNEKENK